MKKKKKKPLDVCEHSYLWVKDKYSNYLKKNERFLKNENFLLYINIIYN